MDLTSGLPFWLIKNGLMTLYPQLDRDLSCDVVVIGGGITGALAAYHLVEAGINTILVDKRNIGFGSTSATTALLQYEIDTPMVELAKLVGTDHAVRSYKACLEAIYKLERICQELGNPCGFERKKSLYLASSRRDVGDLQDEYAMRKEHGFAVDWWDGDEVAAHFPFRRPAAILSHDGAQLDAYCLAHHLLQQSVAQGLQVFTRSNVVKFESESGTPQRIRLQMENGCQVVARHVVFATGYESQQYLKQQVASLISTYALASEPMKDFGGWYEECLLWESARPYLYLRTTPDHRVIMGGEDEDFRDPKRRDRLLRRKTKTLQRKFQQLFPDQKLEVAFSWTGTFGETKDGLPYIGATPEFPAAYFILGYGGNGIVFSLLGAEIVRDTILGRENPMAELFRFDR